MQPLVNPAELQVGPALTQLTAIPRIIGCKHPAVAVAQRGTRGATDTLAFSPPCYGRRPWNRPLRRLTPDCARWDGCPLLSSPPALEPCAALPLLCCHLFRMFRPFARRTASMEGLHRGTPHCWTGRAAAVVLLGLVGGPVSQGDDGTQRREAPHTPNDALACVRAVKGRSKLAGQ